MEPKITPEEGEKDNKGTANEIEGAESDQVAEEPVNRVSFEIRDYVKHIESFRASFPLAMSVLAETHSHFQKQTRRH